MIMTAHIGACGRYEAGASVLGSYLYINYSKKR
ncbi:MAG: hypothetical protein ACJA1U_001356 [Bermanella sp.]|jgi:hypothetical protein